MMNYGDTEAVAVFPLSLDKITRSPVVNSLR